MLLGVVSSIGVFHVFQIVQMVPNYATHYDAVDYYFQKIVHQLDGKFHNHRFFHSLSICLLFLMNVQINFNIANDITNTKTLQFYMGYIFCYFLDF